MSGLRIGFVAPSSVIPQYEFELGLERLRKAGFDVKVHPQCRKKHLFFAGTDEERAVAFVEMANDPAIDVLWCARGGYGAYRLLPILDRLVPAGRRPPRKILAGYSDPTCLFEYVRKKWGWPVLHSPMPGLRNFMDIGRAEFAAMTAWLEGRRPESAPFGRKKLSFFGKAPAAPVEGSMVGGNLAMWQVLLGTPNQIDARDKILFFEEVGETLSRIDVKLHQLMQSGSLDGARAIVLGDFKHCTDPVTEVLQAPKRGSKAKPKLAPVRSEVPLKRYFEEIFGGLAECYGIPVAHGLPVGHGPGKYSLPMGGSYRLSPDGTLELLHWEGLRT